MLVYDCEIVKMIPNKKETPVPDIEYCKGWGDFGGMGISVIGVYDFKEDKYRVFMRDNLDEFQKLINERKIMVGFNSIGFDNKLCAAHGLNLSNIQHYDLMLAIAELANPTGDPEKINFRGCGLEACCKANFEDISKNGDGALAPLLWQKGEIGKVVDYCLNDVKMTLAICEKIIYEGFVYSPIDGTKLEISIKDGMRKAINE